MLIHSYTTWRFVASTSGLIVADGFEAWPSAEVVAAAFTGIPKFGAVTITFPITVSVGGATNHHAWLSQRTEVAADQYFSIVEANATVDAWTISLTDRAVTELGLALQTSALNEAQLKQAVRDVRLYTQRVSDDSIRHVGLDKAMFADF